MFRIIFSPPPGIRPSVFALGWRIRQKNLPGFDRSKNFLWGRVGGGGGGEGGIWI